MPSLKVGEEAPLLVEVELNVCKQREMPPSFLRGVFPAPSSDEVGYHRSLTFYDPGRTETAFGDD